MAELFIDTHYNYRRQGKCELHAFVVMPEHFHLLITPAPGTAIERAMQFVKGGYSHRARTQLNSAMEIWERGFTDHRIRDEGDFARHRDYIHANPVERRLATKQTDYRYSSAFAGYELDQWPSAAKAGNPDDAERHGSSRALPETSEAGARRE